MDDNRKAELTAKQEIAVAIGNVDNRLDAERAVFAETVTKAMRAEITAEQKRRAALGMADAPLELTPAMVMRVMLAVDNACDRLYGTRRGDGGGALGAIIDETTKQTRRGVWDRAASETRDALEPRRMAQLQRIVDDINKTT